VPWPSLGGQVVDFIETHLTFGPGDLRGRPAVLDEEQRYFVWRMYEVHPKGSEREGKRRFQRCALSLRKGLRKTEFAAWIAAAELHREAPVRCDGFHRVDGVWQPVGRPVADPYIPLVAYTEEQSEDLVFGALKAMIEEGPLARDFDCSLERIIRIDGKGKAVPLATSPSARDGARTTFENFDEAHRLTSPRQRSAHKTMLGNLLKRPIADPWSLETTTMYAPGERSVAEGTHDYARKVESGAIKDSRLFFFHRQAAQKADISTPLGLRTAVIEASGPIATVWSDIDGIAAQWDDPDADLSYLDRTWLNRPVRAHAKAFDIERWKQLARLDYVPDRAALIVLGFDGSRTRDHTALIATEIASGFQWPLAIWAPEVNADGLLEIDVDAVDAVVTDAFEHLKVWRMYADPPYWQEAVRDWQGRFGKTRVLEFWTSRERPMCEAVRSYESAIATGDLSHGGELDGVFTAHIGNAHRRYLAVRDERGEQMFVIQKERPDSDNKMDAAMGGILSWEGRLQALREGVNVPPEPSVYETRGFRVLRRDALTCPDCGRDTVIKRRDRPGWRCPALEGGCNQVFEPDDTRLLDQLAEAAPV
jgi:hypothetical protein